MPLKLGLSSIARLSKDKAALFLDRFDAENAVAAAPREHDADRVVPAILRERTEKHVDRAALGMAVLDLMKSERPALDRQRRVGRQNVNAVRLNLLAIARDMDGQAGVAREYVREEAFAIWGEVRDNHKGHAEIGGDGFEELLEGPQPTGGSANANDGESGIRRHNFRLMI